MINQRFKILNFYNKTLTNYIVNFHSATPLANISISKVTELANKLKKYYPQEPRLFLMPSPGQKFEIGLSPLVFTNPNNRNQIQIHRDFVQFIFTEYDSWKIEFDKIIYIIDLLKEYFQFNNTKSIQLTSIDSFLLPTDNFKLEKYFSFSINSEFDMHYEDFHYGFVPHLEPLEEGLRKVVIKIRGVGIEKKDFKFVIETSFFLKDTTIEVNSMNFKNELNNAHSLLDTAFILSLEEKYKDKIGLIVEIDESFNSD